MKRKVTQSPKTDGNHVIPTTLWSTNTHDILREAEVKSSISNFILLKPSSLKLDDEFMKHEPQTGRERKLKRRLAAVILAGDVKDFWCPKHNPSFNEEENRIYFEMGSTPATISKTFYEWDKLAKKFMPKCKSRLGTKDEYVVFLGFIIKSLVETGWEINAAWNAVCNDSYALGHYKNNSQQVASEIIHEPTSSREVCGFYDLADSVKYLGEDEDSACYYIASGCCYDDSDKCPISSIYPDNATNYSYPHSVGWVVLEKSVFESTFGGYNK